MENSKYIPSLKAAFAALTTALSLGLSLTPVQAEDLAPKDRWISPVTNPIYFEDPRITTEVRPVFLYQKLPDTFHAPGLSLPLGGDLQVYAVQARVALSDRLALIATKDGYININPSNTISSQGGWANIAAGLKYALVDDEAAQLRITPGVTFELPTGNLDNLQGYGSGEWNPFVSAAKGFGDFHITGNIGARIPNDTKKQTTQLHYSLQLDHYVCRYFIPFITATGHTVLDNGNQKLAGAVDLNTELNDLINFGSTRAKNTTQISVGAGFRSKLTTNVDFGFAYEIPATHPIGIFERRITADLIWRF